MRKYFDTVTSTLTGKPLAGALVRVKIQPDGGGMPATSSATLYSDVNGTELANPVTADANGLIEFFAANGVYTLEYLYGGDTIKTIADVDISEDVTALALADTSGAALVGTSDGATVQTALGYRSCATRTAMGSLASTALTTVLRESGREGTFIWNSGNMSANVTADPAKAVYVPPASDTSGASGAWVRNHGGVFNLMWFGAVIDSTTDDTVAWQRACTLVMHLGGGKIQVPYGATGRSKVTGQIINNTELFGIEFEGIGKPVYSLGGSNYYAVVLEYTGADTCWDIQNEGDYVGGLVFEKIGFAATNAAGTMFSINDGSSTTTVNVFEFKSCGAFGPDAGASQTGDFLRLENVFNSMITDSACNVRGWRRGISLDSCDVIQVAGNFTGNGCHIRNVRIDDTTAGNSLTILPGTYLGGLSTTSLSGDDICNVYDQGSKTLWLNPYCETSGSAVGPFLYSNGTGLRVVGGNMSTQSGVNPPCKIGPDAKDTRFIAVDALNDGTFEPAVITDATFPNPGNLNQNRDFFVTLEGCSPGFIAMFGDNPRVRVTPGTVPRTVTRPGVQRYVDERGSRPASICMSPLNSEFTSNNLPAPSTDTASPCGSAWRISGSSGINATWFLRIGKDLMPGDVVYFSVLGRHEGSAPGYETMTLRHQNNAGSTVVDIAFANYADTAFHRSLVGPFTITEAFGNDNGFLFKNDGAGGTYFRIAEIQLVQARGPQRDMIRLAAAPTAGTWIVGDIVLNSAPASAGYIGWVCTTAGTPGTWKTFGLIS